MKTDSFTADGEERIPAAAPAPPLQVQLEAKQLENDSTLGWQPPAGGPLPGYEVLWRKTDRRNGNT